MIRYKSFVVAFTLIVATCMTVHADLLLSVSTPGGFVPNRADLPGGIQDELTGVLTLTPNDRIDAHIMLAPDGIIDPAGPGGLPFQTSPILDIILDTFSIGATGSGADRIAEAPQEYAAFNSNYTYSNTFQSGSVYLRVFDTEIAFVDIGDWYYDGDPIIASDLDPGPPLPIPQSIPGNRNTLPLFGVGDEMFLPIVPEPSTLALVSLGLLAAARRRRRKSQDGS